MVALPTLNAMRYPVLTVPAILDYASLQILTMQLYTNAASVPSYRGNGLLGHAFLVLGQIAYTIAAGQAFVAPTNPGTPPDLDNATAAQIAAITSNYSKATDEWDIYTATNSILMTQLLTCIDKKYYEELIDRTTGITAHSLFEILTHLRAEHGRLTKAQIRANRAALEDPWEPDITMAPLWRRTQDIVAIGAAGNDVIDDGAITRALHLVLTLTGQFSRALGQWDDKLEADQTWANFKTHFNAANRRRLETLTATAAGLGGNHTANAAIANNQAVPNAPAATTVTINIETGRSYCWTHGYCLGSNHTSLTCRNKAPGHRDDATILDMFGGNNSIARNRNQPAIYRSPRHHLGAHDSPATST